MAAGVRQGLAFRVQPLASRWLQTVVGGRSSVPPRFQAKESGNMRLMRICSVGFLASLSVAGAVAQLQPPGQAGGRIAPPGQLDPSAAPKLVITQDTWNFGTKFRGEPAEGEVAIRNDGFAPLKFRVQSSCGCTVGAVVGAQDIGVDAEGFKYVMNPASQATLKITYNTHKNTKLVNQTITIVSNDPSTPQQLIKVQGEVIELFGMTTPEGQPSDRVQFPALVRTANEQKELILKNQVGQDIGLKLRDVANAPFTAELQTISEGKEYKLTVKTKPPLNVGANNVEIVMETTHPQMKELRIPVNAYVQPRVTVNRPSIPIAGNLQQKVKHGVRVTYQAAQPVKITGFKADPANLIEAKVLPPKNLAAPPPGGFAWHDVEIELGPGAQFPPTGGTVKILTDDPEYPELEIKVIVVNVKPRDNQAAATPATPQPGTTITPPGGLPGGSAQPAAPGAQPRSGKGE